MPTIILCINTEVFCTKIAISEDEKIVYQCDIDHSKEDFVMIDNIMEQLPFRRDAIMNQLHYDVVDVKSIQYVVAEGGLLKPCETGVYEIAIETDGYQHHKEGTTQSVRDEKKNRILATYGIPLLRLSTIGSNERQQVEDALRGGAN